MLKFFFDRAMALLIVFGVMWAVMAYQDRHPKKPDVVAQVQKIQKRADACLAVVIERKCVPNTETCTDIMQDFLPIWKHWKKPEPETLAPEETTPKYHQLILGTAISVVKAQRAQSAAAPCSMSSDFVREFPLELGKEMAIDKVSEELEHLLTHL